MIYLQISDDLIPALSPTVIETAAKTTLESVEEPIQADLTILLTTDHQMQGLSRDYLSVDAPTDVLAFPADYIDPDTQAHYLGDVIISQERAILQAEQGEHSLEQEIELLVVHGILHLLGYDHDEPEAKERMWAAQAKILAQLGNSISST